MGGCNAVIIGVLGRGVFGGIRVLSGINQAKRLVVWVSALSSSHNYNVIIFHDINCHGNNLFLSEFIIFCPTIYYNVLQCMTHSVLSLFLYYIYITYSQCRESFRMRHKLKGSHR